MNQPNAFITVRQLMVEYVSQMTTNRALAGINFSVQKGEFVTIVGPSGCGKSTLLRVIAGFIAPTQGEVLVQGTPIAGPHHSRGVVFQEPTLYPWLSARGNIEFGLKARKLPDKQRREISEAMLKLVGLWDFRDTPPYELSGGMQQRIAIARVLANQPDILLMDEPFAALDAFTRRQLQEELKTIWRRSAQTILFITHNVDEAIYLSTTVLVMSSRPGQIMTVLHPPFSKLDGEVTSRQVRSDPQFMALCRQVEDVIEEAHHHL